LDRNFYVRKDQKAKKMRGGVGRGGDLMRIEDRLEKKKRN